MRQRWWDHLGLLLSGALFVLVLVRVLFAAGFDTTTAMAILQHGGTANVVLGSTFASLPLLTSLMTGHVVARFVFGPRPGLTWLPLLLLGLVLAVAYVALVAFAAVAILIVLGLLIHWCRRGKSTPPTAPVTEEEVPDQSLLTTGLLFLVLLPMSASSWLPTEELSVRGSASFTGYVLASEGADTYLLTEEVPEHVQSVPTEYLKRRLCQTEEVWYGITLWDLQQRDRYPECPR